MRMQAIRAMAMAASRANNEQELAIIHRCLCLGNAARAQCGGLDDARHLWVAGCHSQHSP